MKNGNIHAGHRNRLKEQYHNNGITSLNEINYLEALLNFSIPRADTTPIAHNLINTFGSLDAVFRADFSQLIRVDGVGKHTADLITLVGASEYFKNKSKLNKHPSLKTFNLALTFIRSVLPPSSNEQFVVIALRKNLTVENYKVFKGLSHSKISVDATELINFLVANPTGFFMFAHTHPFHNAKPSESDIKQFNNLVALANSLSFQMIDNIILGENEFYSYKLSKISTYNEIDFDYNNLGSSQNMVITNSNKTQEGFLTNNTPVQKTPNMNNTNAKTVFVSSIPYKKSEPADKHPKVTTPQKENIWKPVDDANGKITIIDSTDALFTMEDFKKKYSQKPHFNTLEEQKAWIKQYSEDFIRANKNNKKI